MSGEARLTAAPFSGSLGIRLGGHGGKYRKNFKLKLFFASLAFALAVGCRPTCILYSALIPVLLWDKVSFRNVQTLKIALSILIPFAVIGSILAWYNYARFGSIFEFGITYQITVQNVNALKSMNFSGKIYKYITGMLVYSFNPPSIDVAFPFVTSKMSLVPVPETCAYDKGHVIGFMSIPIMLGIFLKTPQIHDIRKFIYYGFFISIVLIAIISSNGFLLRYSADFIWVLAMISVIKIACWQGINKFRSKISCILCFLSIAMVFFLCLRTDLYFTRQDANPALYHYLARMFGVICNVP